jgi:hypothetical protein
MSGMTAPRARLAHAVAGRLRVRLHAPLEPEHLHRLAGELERIPYIRTARVDRAARSVTVTFDPLLVSAPVLLDQLCSLGLVVLDPFDLAEWGQLLAAELVPRAENSATLPGHINRELRAASAGRLDLLRVATGLLLLLTGLEVRAALARGEAIHWLRVLAFLLTVASIWSRHLFPAGAAGRARRAGPLYGDGRSK